MIITYRLDPAHANDGASSDFDETKRLVDDGSMGTYGSFKRNLMYLSSSYWKYVGLVDKTLDFASHDQTLLA